MTKPTDLIGTKWLLNETLGRSQYDGQVSLSLISSGNEYSFIDFDSNLDSLRTLEYERTRVYDDNNGGWVNEAYRLVEITGGIVAQEEFLIDWFYNNGIQLLPNSVTNILTGKLVAGWKNASGSELVKMTNLYTGKEINFWRSRLPYPYQEVKYIESTGTQYINTNLSSELTDELELRNVICTRKQIEVVEPLFSADSGAYSTILLVCGTVGQYKDYSAYYKYNATGTAPTVSTNFSLDNATNIFIKKDGSLYYNDIKVSQCPPVQSPNAPFSFFIRANDGSKATARLGEIICKNGTTEKWHLVPCYDSTDTTKHTAGLYDIINNQFYGNDGTGYFLVGEDVYA